VSHPPTPSLPARKIAIVDVTWLLMLAAVPAHAQSTAMNGPEILRGFYATLLSTMKDGPTLGTSGRYAKLEPAVRKTFDVPFMTRLAIGPSWGGAIGDPAAPGERRIRALHRGHLCRPFRRLLRREARGLW
jgi:hypothetical protein